MGKKSRLKRESVRYSDTPELPSWVITPLSVPHPVRDDDRDRDGSADEPDEPRGASDPARPRDRIHALDEAVPEA